MPPNRKEVASISRTLSTEQLASFIRTAKFPPLTGRSEEEGAKEEGIKESWQHQGAAAPRRQSQEEKKEWVEGTCEEEEEEEGENAADSKGASSEPHYWDWPTLSPNADEAIKLSAADVNESRDLANAAREESNVRNEHRRAIVARILAEDEARKVLSAHAIESNLRKDATRRCLGREAVIDSILREDGARVAVGLDGIVSNLIRDADRRRREEGMGDGGTSLPPSSEVKEEDGYWDWSDGTALAAIPDESANVASLSTSRIVELIQKEARRIEDGKGEADVDIHGDKSTTTTTNSNNVRRGGGDVAKKNDTYWEWRTLTEDEEKMRIVESILEHEKARLLLRSTHVVSNLMKDAASRVSGAPCVAGGGRDGAIGESKEEVKEDVEYWSWGGDGNVAFGGERTRAPDTAAAKDDDVVINYVPVDSVSYWDWSPPPLTTDEVHSLRRSVLDAILLDEEARVTTCADSVVEGLKGDTWRRAKEEVDGWYFSMDGKARRGEEAYGTTLDASMDESYWDM